MQPGERPHGRVTRVVLILLLSLAGCSRSDRATTIDAAPNQPDNSASSEELQAALLRIEDLPTGWTSAPAEPSPTAPTVETEKPTGFCNTPIIDTAQVPASAETEFSKGGELSNRLVQLVVSYDNRRQASRAFDEIEMAARACTQWEDTDEDTASSLTLQSLSFPRLGDETLAARMGGEVEPKPDPDDEFSFDITGNIAADIVVVRSGSLITVLGHLGVGIFGPPSLDSAETETIARKAIDRLEAL